MKLTKEFIRKNLFTDRWFPLPNHVRNHKEMKRLLTSEAQYKVIAAGRRSYKTERFLKRRFVFKCMDYEQKGNYFLAAPIRTQAKLIFWEDIKKLTPSWMLAGKPRESELCLEYRTGSKLYVLGLEEYQRIEGILWHGCGITEYQKVSPNFFNMSLQPILNDTGGEAILEGRPLGKNHFYDDFLREKFDPERWASFHWTSEDVLTPQQINAAKNDLGEEDYKREYLADFESGGQRAYYSYSVDNHKKFLYNPTKPVIVTCDFNATEKPMSWTVGQRDGDVTYWIKSLSYTYTNTQDMCLKLDNYFKGLVTYPKSLFFYGDYSGGKYTSNSAYSDWDIIKNYFRTKAEFYLKIKKTTSVRDRVASTNALLKNANKRVRMFVDPEECKPLIRDWDRMGWKENGDLDEDDPRDGHNSASVDYYSDYEFPIKSRPSVIQH